jgi:hypothetical protein
MIQQAFLLLLDSSREEAIGPTFETPPNGDFTVRGKGATHLGGCWAAGIFPLVPISPLYSFEKAKGHVGSLFRWFRVDNGPNNYKDTKH